MFANVKVVKNQFEYMTLMSLESKPKFVQDH